MTAQVLEGLRYQGQDVGMCATPLGDYFKLSGFKPNFMRSHTALWRCYVGQWEIIEKRLYLVGLKGTLKDGTSATLESIFPGFPDRVFAHWFTGTIQIPEGELLEYVHMGYDSIHERDLLLELDCGSVVSSLLRQNSAPVPREGLDDTCL